MDNTTNKPIALSLHQFYVDVSTRALRLQERRGQAMFNHLLKIRPELAEEVRGTDRDPFYAPHMGHPMAIKFIEFIETRWYHNII